MKTTTTNIPTPPFQAVIFDCDGVLVDSETALMNASRAYFGELGLSYTEEEYHDAFVGHAFDHNLAIVYADMQARNLTVPEGFEEELVRRRIKAVRENLQPIDGAFECVARLTLKKAVASNTVYRSWLEEKLEAARLLPFFAPHFYTIEDVAQPKPAPDMYLLAAKKLGVDPSACLVVEDSATGARAAVAAGMHTVGLARHGHATEKHIEQLHEAGVRGIITSMHDVHDYIRAQSTATPVPPSATKSPRV